MNLVDLRELCDDCDKAIDLVISSRGQHDFAHEDTIEALKTIRNMRVSLESYISEREIELQDKAPQAEPVAS
ncbi:MAG TPA: hypothetical protein VFR23_26095 [Jiangellaceae bacterium]|nr:hypothetical protein [Jiangellaceae bacterium]